MKQFTIKYIDANVGLKAKIIASGVNRYVFADINRGKAMPRPKVLHQICFVIANETNTPIYDILIAAIKMIESEM
jgi:hypothetical protein